MANYFLPTDQFHALFPGRFPEGAMRMDLDGVPGVLCDDRLQRAIDSWHGGIGRQPSRSIPDLILVELHGWRGEALDPRTLPPIEPRTLPPIEPRTLPPVAGTGTLGLETRLVGGAGESYGRVLVREETIRDRQSRLEAETRAQTEAARRQEARLSPEATARIRAKIAPFGLGGVVLGTSGTNVLCVQATGGNGHPAPWRQIDSADGTTFLAHVLERLEGTVRSVSMSVLHLDDRTVEAAVDAWLASGGPVWSTEEVQRAAFVEAAGSAVARNAEKVRGQILANQEQLRALMRQTTQLLRSIEEDEALLSFADGREGAFRERMEAEWARMRDIDKVPQVLCDAAAGVFCALTVPLTCENPKTGRIHDIGAFEIRIDARQGTLKWINLTRRIGDAHHPHIHGHACLGNLAEALPSLFAGAEYATILQLAIQFVETCNPDDTWGRGIVNWPVAAQADAPVQAAAE